MDHDVPIRWSTSISTNSSGLINVIKDDIQLLRNKWHRYLCIYKADISAVNYTYLLSFPDTDHLKTRRVNLTNSYSSRDGLDLGNIMGRFKRLNLKIYCKFALADRGEFLDSLAKDVDRVEKIVQEIEAWVIRKHPPKNPNKRQKLSPESSTESLRLSEKNSSKRLPVLPRHTTI